MAYGLIDISEVGMAEEPLLRVLHGAIYPGTDWGTLSNIIGMSPDPYLLIAHLEGNPLGYLIATPLDGEFRVHGMGVLAEYRGEGIERRLIERAQGEAKRRGMGISGVTVSN